MLSIIIMGAVLSCSRETRKHAIFVHDDAWNFPTLWLSVVVFCLGFKLPWAHHYLNKLPMFAHGCFSYQLSTLVIYYISITIVLFCINHKPVDHCIHDKTVEWRALISTPLRVGTLLRVIYTIILTILHITLLYLCSREIEIPLHSGICLDAFAW
jgi:predicted secreted protein